MKKISKIKVGIIAILGIILIIALMSFYYFKNLHIYRQEANGEIVSKSGVVYQFNGKLTSSYSGGKLKTDKVIGRFEGENFFSTLFLGPRVVKLKDYNENNTFLVRGIMLQEVYTKRDKKS